MGKFDSQTIQLAIFALVALALVAQAIVFVAMYAVLRRSVQSLTEKIDETRVAVLPVVENTRDLLIEIKPKIIETTTDLAALSKSLRAQTGDVQSAATEIIARVRHQAARIDGLLTNSLDAVERASGYMTSTVTRPVRQLSALVASVKAAVEALRTFEPTPRAHQDDSDGDMFV